MDRSSQSDFKRRPRWKLFFWTEVILFLAWFILKKVPSIEEMGAGGAIDFLLVLSVIVVALIWLLFMNRLSWKVRLIGVGVVW